MTTRPQEHGASTLPIERPTRRGWWPMWATAAGALGFAASALIDERPDVGGTEAVTPELVDRLSTGPFHLALVCGYLAVAALIVLAGLWRRNVEHRFPGSAGASIVHAGLVASAAGLSLAYGWKGALSRYLEAGPEHATFDERGTFVYFMLTDFSPYVAWLGVTIACVALAWMAWREALVSRFLGTTVGVVAGVFLAGSLATGIPGLPAIGSLLLVVLGPWLTFGRHAGIERVAR
ncbi:hypothetical protein [Pimelobacter simplex]|uniref:hypothetical protein n=1 Tax=Nocardioides simplex TaxID=2045 RepID=UPI00214F7719|nr:hypothetical protein [Pimelobacter simplex]UUW87451.1 hypothetical protein M0M43_17060 [Pimelobacter simplex]UUW96956.1 hypothetical protein M0M48_05705 [Pimelobacter simplex]